MEDRLKDLYTILSANENGMDTKELQVVLGVDGEELDGCILALRDSGELWVRRDGKLTTSENEGLKRGKLRAHPRGFAFLDVPGEEEIFIPKKAMRSALHQDEVLVRIDRIEDGKKREGQVLKVLTRNPDPVLGVVSIKNGKKFAKPTDRRLPSVIQLEGDEAIHTVVGHIVQIRLTDFRENQLAGEVLRTIGHINDPGSDILTIVHDHGLHTEFPDEVLKETEAIPLTLSAHQRKDRTDLTNETIITIDGEDAKDLDDAIQVKRLENGNFELGVHIADVSAYIPDGSFLDKEAFRRGTSVYLVDRVLPMIPHKLSNGVCSLHPGEERLTLSCTMEIDESGHVVRYELFESIIQSTERMTYTDVNAILNEQDPTLTKRYQRLLPMLEAAKDLSLLLRKQRMTRGSIDFDLKEAKVLVDEDCKPIDIQYRARSTGEKMIEEFMLITNETVATHFEKKDLPFLYRVHQRPEKSAVRNFMRFVGTYGLEMKKKKVFRPKDFQRLIQSIKGKREEVAISRIMLRTMQQAKYESVNVGHFGLASNTYTHFTSPIRRYPDLMVHRLIKDLVIEKKRFDREELHEKISIVALNSSEKERMAMDAERETVALKKTEYMKKDIGNVFPGTIVSVTKFGFFVELENTIEGLVHTNSLGGHYEFDETAHRLINTNNNRTFTLGDQVQVRVLAADVEERTIDFELVSIKRHKKAANKKKPRRGKIRSTHEDE